MSAVKDVLIHWRMIVRHWAGYTLLSSSPQPPHHNHHHPHWTVINNSSWKVRIYGKNLVFYLVHFCSGPVTMFSCDTKWLPGFLGGPFEYEFANVKLWLPVSQLIQSKFSLRKPTCLLLIFYYYFLLEESFAQRNCNKGVSFKNSHSKKWIRPVNDTHFLITYLRTETAGRKHC
jgi:hypothetical protein